MPPKNNTRSWGYEYFLEHPSASLIPKIPSAFADDKMMRKKIFCKMCFAACVQDEMKSDDEAVQAGTRSTVRDQQTIEEACTLFYFIDKYYMYWFS